MYVALAEEHDGTAVAVVKTEHEKTVWEWRAKAQGRACAVKSAAISHSTSSTPIRSPPAKMPKQQQHMMPLGVPSLPKLTGAGPPPRPTMSSSGAMASTDTSAVDNELYLHDPDVWHEPQAGQHWSEADHAEIDGETWHDHDDLSELPLDGCIQDEHQFYDDRAGSWQNQDAGLADGDDLPNDDAPGHETNYAASKAADDSWWNQGWSSEWNSRSNSWWAREDQQLFETPKRTHLAQQLRRPNTCDLSSDKMPPAAAKPSHVAVEEEVVQQQTAAAYESALKTTSVACTAPAPAPSSDEALCTQRASKAMYVKYFRSVHQSTLTNFPML